MNLKLEAIVVPVSDVDRAKTFYAEALGFRVDVDHSAARYEEGLGFRHRGSDNSFATFSDPDGNGWLLQEITERAPGR